MAHFGDVIRAERERRGLDETFVAARCGLNIPSYGDVEMHSGEFFEAISLGQARRICSLLGLDFLGPTEEYFGAVIRVREPATDVEFVNRHHLIGDAQRRKGLSDEALSNTWGWKIGTVLQIQREPDYVECMPINALVDLARVLQVDPGLLLRNQVANVVSGS